VIFVTVGTQLPFPRLINTIALWSIENNFKEEVICQCNRVVNQIGIKTINQLSPKKFNDLISNASLVVSHAGIGSIISCLEMKKPLILFPRRKIHHEHRNDHQLATCEAFKNNTRMNIAWDENELIQLLNNRNQLKINEDKNSLDNLEKLKGYLKSEIDSILI